VLAVAHLAPPRTFYVGEPTADAPCDVVIPAEALGAPRVPLVWVEPSGSVLLVIPAGALGTIATSEGTAPLERGSLVPFALGDGALGEALRLEPGATVTLTLGAFTFSIATTPPMGTVFRRYHRHGKGAAFIAGSAIAQAGLLALLACAPTMSADDVDDARRETIARVLRVAAEKELLEQQEQAETTTASSSDAKREGGTGTRAKGEEGASLTGSMGNAPAPRITQNRYGVSGPSDAGRASALAGAQEFGMIGLLNAGSGGDPNAPSAPWGRDDSLGADPVGFGGGPGLSGTGPGGGGRGSGIGLGGIGGIGSGGGGKPSGHGAAGAPPALAAGGARSTGPAAPQPIDPNGRFTTTYRPGKGHLAAFESALARGMIPAAERAVVSDVGGGFTAPLTHQNGEALALRADLERAALPPTGGATHLRLAIQSSAKAPDARPHLSVHLVMDVSGSMAGESIARAREAAAALVERLAPTDDFSLVAFSSEADVRVPDGLVGPRRKAILEVIRALKEDGGTNIGAGLTLGYAQASSKTIPADAVKVVLLLSDGRATGGILGQEHLSRLALDAFQHGIQTSALGIGTDYDGPLMSSIATDGAGGYYYLRDGAQIAPALTTELEQRVDPVATAVEVRVRLRPGVKLLRVYGSRRMNEVESGRVREQEVAADAHARRRDAIATDRNEDRQGGMRFFMPAFARDDRHAMLLEVDVPEGVGAANLGVIEVKYKDRLLKKNVIRELPLRAEYAGSDAASAATVDASVTRTVQGFAAGEALTNAASRIERNDRAGAVALLAEREGILRQAAASLDEPLFVTEADRLARLRSHAGESAGLGEPLVLALLLDSAGQARLR
jgi:Ca-activated chloride channel homolog